VHQVQQPSEIKVNKAVLVKTFKDNNVGSLLVNVTVKNNLTKGTVAANILYFFLFAGDKQFQRLQILSILQII
jgi:hypothetical protein